MASYQTKCLKKLIHILLIIQLCLVFLLFIGILNTTQKNLFKIYCLILLSFLKNLLIEYFVFQKTQNSVWLIALSLTFVLLFTYYAITVWTFFAIFIVWNILITTLLISNFIKNRFVNNDHIVISKKQNLHVLIPFTHSEQHNQLQYKT